MFVQVRFLFQLLKLVTMKTVLTLFTVVVVLSSCQTAYHTQNTYGIREWKAGKMMKHNRRPNERPQCVDAW